MTKHLLPGAAALLLISTSASAATILINEDFNSPEAGATNNTTLRGTADFPEWNFSDTNGLTPQYKVGPADGSPVSAGDGYVKFDSFGGSGGGADGIYTVQYDTGYNWTADDSFTLSINATEQNWGSANDRFMVIKIKETSRTGNDLTGATLWTVTEALILDTNHDSSGEGWGPNNSFSYTFNTADFLTNGGTEGSLISFELSGSGSRGYHFDNVLFSVDTIPEPSTTALAGIAGLALVLRRRR